MSSCARLPSDIGVYGLCVLRSAFPHVSGSDFSRFYRTEPHLSESFHAENHIFKNATFFSSGHSPKIHQVCIIIECWWRWFISFNSIIITYQISRAVRLCREMFYFIFAVIDCDVDIWKWKSVMVYSSLVFKPVKRGCDLVVTWILDLDHFK